MWETHRYLYPRPHRASHLSLVVFLIALRHSRFPLDRWVSSASVMVTSLFASGCSPEFEGIFPAARNSSGLPVGILCTSFYRFKSKMLFILFKSGVGVNGCYTILAYSLPRCGLQLHVKHKYTIVQINTQYNVLCNVPTPARFCIFLLDLDPDPESKFCDRPEPEPESLFNFGSSRSLCGHFLSKKHE